MGSNGVGRWPNRTREKPPNVAESSLHSAIFFRFCRAGFKTDESFDEDASGIVFSLFP